MTSPGKDRPAANTADDQAADWFARLRQPHGPEDEAAFARWRAADPSHASAYDELLLLWDRTRFLGNTATGKGRDLARAKMRSRTMRRGTIIAAAAAFLLLCIGGISWGYTRSSMLLAPPVQVEDPIRTGVGEIRTVRLADGSAVTLDTDTILFNRFSDDTRGILLQQGRARFMIRHDASRPFVVTAGGRTVTARGTVFDVGVTPVGVAIRLLSGAVDVSAGTETAGAAPAPIQHLSAGQQLAIPAQAMLPRPVPLEADETDWPSGLLTFSNTRLVDAVAEVNRYNRIKIGTSGPISDDHRVSGAYRATDAPGFAAAMAAIFALRVNRISSASIILSAASEPDVIPAS